MSIDRVTITGADDSVKTMDLVFMSQKWPFVEWGILLSKTSVGRPRFPSYQWLSRLRRIAPSLQLSGHVCGTWVRDMLVGGRMFKQDMDDYLSMFNRLQWNFHAETNHSDREAMTEALMEYSQDHIFQMDGVNNGLMFAIRASGTSNINPLFDLSGGAGIVPEIWPQAHRGMYCGYAGGLGPDTLEEQLPRILHAAQGQRIWLDMEGRLRTDDERLDMEKVMLCLQICDPMVKG